MSDTTMINACLNCGTDETGHDVCPTCGEETVEMTAAFFAEGLAEIAAEAQALEPCATCGVLTPSRFCSDACRLEDEAEHAASDPSRPDYYGREGSTW